LLIFEKNTTFAPLTLTLEREDIGGITGAIPTIAIRNAITIDSYLDFTGFTFKSTGWTTKYEPMMEVEEGDYTYFLNLDAITAINVGDMLSVEFHYDDGSVVHREQETVAVVESLFNIATDTSSLINIVGGTLTLAQATQLMEVWQILGLDSANPLNVCKTSRSAGLITQSIQKNVPVAGNVRVTRL
jgi:hypothetical protein